jgi:hypothetical protein
LEVRGTLSILYLGEWLKTKNLTKIISWFEHYLSQSQASAIHAQRLVSLMDCLRNMDRGADTRTEIAACIDQIKRIPLDYTSPESAIEIIPIDFILELI